MTLNVNSASPSATLPSTARPTLKVSPATRDSRAGAYFSNDTFSVFSKMLTAGVTVAGGLLGGAVAYATTQDPKSAALAAGTSAALSGGVTHVIMKIF